MSVRLLFRRAVRFRVTFLINCLPALATAAACQSLVAATTTTLAEAAVALSLQQSLFALKQGIHPFFPSFLSPVSAQPLSEPVVAPPTTAVIVTKTLTLSL